MFCSTIIPTIGRPSLSNAVTSVLNQNFSHAENEIIVVNDSGKPLPEAEWQKSEKVTIIHTNRHNRSVARNSGASIAKGKYLHFLDDDDWILPDAFESFWELANNSQADWLYGAFRLVDNSGTSVTEIFPDETGNCSIQLVAWEWLPLQASFISAKAFFEVGGFASLHSLQGGFEDVDLSRQISLYSDMARTDMVVTSIRAGDAGSTTNYVDMFKQNRQSREKTLGMLGAFHRLLDSARSSPSGSSYWHGKIIYYYLASMKWNAQKGDIFTSASRFCYSVVGLLLSGRHFFATDFWRGVIKPHYPRMGTALQAAGADHLYSETRRNINMSGG
jgi:glycosyltransferase involved in cell wall biosynthesis